MADDEYYEEEDEVDLDSINDEQTLIDMLDEAEDFDERKRIRDRLMKVQHEIKTKRAEAFQKREDDREAALKKKQQDADDKKKRTLTMYDQMAKSAPAGAQKTMDVNVYKYNDAPMSRPESPSQRDAPKKDLVEEAIRERINAADTRKKRMLAAFDHAAKSGPAGPKIVNFDNFKRADVSKYTPSTPPVGNSTFGMSGGIPQFDKGALNVAKTPKNEEEDLDPMEKAIRQRKREADDNKRRTLAAYDMVAKSGTVGPKVVILEEFRNLKVSPDMKMGSSYDPTASFHAGVLATGQAKR